MMLIAALAAVASSLGACGPTPAQLQRSRFSDFDMKVATEPPGGRCVLSSPGRPDVVFDPTPADRPVARSREPATLRCEAPGHAARAITLTPVPDDVAIHQMAAIGGGFFGLAGMAVGAVIGGASGSTLRYEDTTLALPPERFSTLAERDAWFAAEAARIQAAAARRVAQARASCGPDDRWVCEERAIDAQAQGAAALAELETFRRGLPDPSPGSP